LLVGALLLVFGLLGVIVAIFALVDPAGAKLADDGNPFGPPPSRVQSVQQMVAFAVTALAGAWLIARRRTARHSGAK